MQRKIGKPAAYNLVFQDYLIHGIDNHIKSNRIQEMAYLQSPIREDCITCGFPLKEADFTRNSISFSFCIKCGHLNGRNISREENFIETYQLTKKSGIDYDTHYLDSKSIFEEKVKNIYNPKAKFFKDSILYDSPRINISKINILDFGTASGHMVLALKENGFNNTKGIDPMLSAINHGKEILGIQELSYVPINESISYLRDINLDVVVMMCVLPHIQNQHKILSAMCENPNIKYTFQKFPMFSLASLLDINYSDINSRVLAGAHTNLYTEESLKWIEKKYNLRRVSEWRFGSDILDLYRNLSIKMSKSDFSSVLQKRFKENFVPLIDKLQYSLDDGNFASEIHLVWEFVK